jgi:hypothetical protein
VPKIRLAPEQERLAFRRRLASAQGQAFDGLVKLVADPRPDLDWHHRLGNFVRRLRLQDISGRGQVRSLDDLAGALGVSPALLQKSLRFADEYPRRAAVRQLEELGADWTRLMLTLAVPDRQERHALLTQAVREGWSSERLRYEVQKRHPTGRRGVGGPTPRNPQALDPELTLRKLERLSQGWRRHYEHARSAVKRENWRRMVRDWPPERRDTLDKLLDEAEVALGDLLNRCQKARDLLADLRREM